MNTITFRTPTLLARCVALAVTLGAASMAHAVTINYQYTGTVSGTFTAATGTATTFSGRLMDVLITTDTTNINTTRFGAGIPATAALVTGSISLSGFGSGTFSLPLYAFNNQNTQVVGFGDLTHNDLVSFNNTTVGLNTFDMKSNFGPITGTPFVSQFNNVALSFGTLTLNTLTNGSFKSTVGVVPEPQSWALMGAGAALMAFAARRRLPAA